MGAAQTNLSNRITRMTLAFAPERIETVPIKPEWRTWRTTSIGISPWSEKRPMAEEFIKFNRSPEGIEIWRKFGWKSIHDARIDND